TYLGTTAPPCLFFFSSRRRHTRFSRDWSSDVCSSDLHAARGRHRGRSIGHPVNGASLIVRNQQTACRIHHGIYRPSPSGLGCVRSEERRVGKEGGAWWTEGRV